MTSITEKAINMVSVESYSQATTVSEFVHGFTTRWILNIGQIFQPSKNSTWSKLAAHGRIQIISIYLIEHFTFTLSTLQDGY